MNKVSGRYEVKTSKIGPGGKRTLYEMKTFRHQHSFEIGEDGQPGKTETRLIDEPDRLITKMNGHEEILAHAFRSMAMRMHRESSE